METRNWSKLPLDIIGSLLERLSFLDFNRAKIVCLDWYTGSKLSVPRKNGSPWLSLFPEDGGCVLYNPDEDKVYRSFVDFSGVRVIANYSNWFLVLDTQSHVLYIKDMFSKTKIDLPPLDSLISDNTYALTRVGDTKYRWEFTCGSCSFFSINNLRARLWVDEKSEEFSVVWFFKSAASYLCVCKKGDHHYTVIPIMGHIPKLLKGLSDVVLRGYRLYIFTIRHCVRVLDISGHQSFKDVTPNNPQVQMFSPLGYNSAFSIAVTTPGEVLLVESTIFEGKRIFNLYKMDPNADPDDPSADLLEVDSLGDEALLLDLGITVPANNTLGIKPNSIYFTRHGRASLSIDFDLDICVFNLATNNLKRFPSLANMNIKDAQWFLT